ncbi:hypothetical protein CORC01_10565 [Colletotrichum orchidophilum]|uniref:Uncharacterized protein n=1 Tax=Colletotrichum orchidophilum TaxID=1209926 RepID=A0A1G4AY66_9PEZI|nr:uncharacterized protein CORC01_10565 [Colletotrichum orchidophilum]OHE94108.1 hypothetical protein CORC01_10565 [Colletotrichum orchidophilum]
MRLEWNIPRRHEMQRRKLQRLKWQPPSVDKRHIWRLSRPFQISHRHRPKQLRHLAQREGHYWVGGMGSISF